MSMLTRAGTLVRKHRRRFGSIKGAPRRRSAPTVLQRSANSRLLTAREEKLARLSIASEASNRSNAESSPSKSVSFNMDNIENGRYGSVPNSPLRLHQTKVVIVQPEHESSKRMLSFQTPPPEKVFYDSTVVWPEIEDEEAGVSVFSGICEAGLESRGPCEFLHRAFFLLSGTWPVTVFLVILLALPLVMTTIGVNYLHDCPREPKLPIYLVVGGCFGILKLIFLLWKQVRRHKDVTDLHDDEDLLTMTRMTNIALNIFLTIWFVFGHYWVVGIWKPHFTAPLHEPRNWCERTVFLFSFWQLVICHIIIALLVAVGFLLLCCYTCVKCLMPENKR